MPLLQATQLAHAFERELFSGVSLEADAGETIAIMGVSGSGKSTLLHALSTLLKPLQGDVKLQGRLETDQGEGHFEREINVR